MHEVTTSPVGRAWLALHRRWALAIARPGRLDPTGPSPARPPRAVLIVQAGPTASVDYYLRPRLEAHPPERGWAVSDMRDRPEQSPLWAEGDLLVIFCRYAPSRWATAVRRRQKASRDICAVHFADDDLEAILADRRLPDSLRGRVALDYALGREALGRVTCAQWVSTPVLAERRGAEAVITPMPFEAVTTPAPLHSKRVVYHGTDSHERERAFVMEVAARLASVRPDIRFEIAQRAGQRLPGPSLATIDWVAQRAWPDYLARQSGRSAAVSLAPLWPGAVNDARASVKIYDADRLGAVGVYASGRVYSPWVEDPREGRLLPMDAAVWAAAIVELIDDPAGRGDMVRAARRRIDDRRRRCEPLPWPLTGAQPS